ncbi:hypothetical protein [Cupriavidus respiraculi]|uniref:hypothetical protein n=1 Tax=Cupriavidus respiraculi TaxID=195930 RepID=UPI001C95EA9C|nr:hypothetical protein [Cupriavidus respiraculi]MBY4946853.1 hypothetical protein [Cupriavidus respiraculi]
MVSTVAPGMVPGQLPDEGAIRNAVLRDRKRDGNRGRRATRHCRRIEQGAQVCRIEGQKRKNPQGSKALRVFFLLL